MKCNHVCMEICVSLQVEGVGCLVIMQLDGIVECAVTVKRDGRVEVRCKPQQQELNGDEGTKAGILEMMRLDGCSEGRHEEKDGTYLWLWAKNMAW